MIDLANAYGSAEQREDRWSSLNDQKKSEILDAAEAEFVAQGFEHASFNKVLVMANLSKGRVYYYLSGKDDLYRRVCERAFARFQEAVGPTSIAASNADSFWVGVDALVQKIMVVLKEDHDLAALGKGVYDSIHAENAVRPYSNRLSNFVNTLVLQGQVIGAVRTDLPSKMIAQATLQTLLCVDRWFAAHLDLLDEDEAQKTSKAAMNMIRNMVGPDQLSSIEGS